MLVKEVLLFMRSQKQGSIIFISSVAASATFALSIFQHEISKSATVQLNYQRLSR